MTTALSAARILLSKEMGDYWAGTSTTPTTAATTTLTDTALMAKANDWIDGDREMYDLITDATVNTNEERKLSSLSNTAGILTMLAHTSNNVADVDYEIHRLFPASEKRRALVYAAKAVYPHLFKEIRDESMVSGNWLKDGALLKWTTSTNPTYWTASSVVTTKTTTLPYYKHSTQSVKLSTPAGYIYQDIALWADLQRLAGKTVTFTAQGHCDTASCLRLGILYDGTNLSYSSYHDGDSAWTEDNDPLSIEYTIDDNPTDIEFRVYHDVAAGTSYVNDLRVIGPYGNRIYIADLGLAQNKPHQVLIEPDNYSTDEPWALIHNINYDQTNGYMYLPDGVPSDYRLRILGNKYLDFYDSSDVVGTDWEDTIAIDSPQIEILVAQAAIYLCLQKIVPNFTSGESQRWMQALAYWQAELKQRIARFGIISPSATVQWE